MGRRPLLPTPLTSFVGRAEDLARLRDLLDRGAHLITLFGPGGIGKTRLALRLAETREAEGAWFFDLTNARNLDEVCGIVGRELDGPAPAPSASAIDAIGAALVTLGPALCILDNCERVASELGEAVVSWCRAARALRVVVTSRELLRVPSEHAYEVAPLGLPHADGEIERSEAVQLFVERAALTRSGYALYPDEADTVAAIVRRLEGLPLGIELAAARMGVLGSKALLDRLYGRLDLGTVRRGMGSRQATLRATLDWSWDLLETYEQAALAQCTCFRGGFSVLAAEAVLNLRVHPDAPPPLEIIQSLREKSLVRAFSTADTSREVRLGLYDTVREYAAEKLEAGGDLEATLARHDAFFLRVAEHWVFHGMKRGARDERMTLVAEVDNLFAVLERALAARPPRVREALLTALASEAALNLRADLRGVLPMLDAVVAAAGPDPTDPALVSLALSARARLSYFNRSEETVAGLERAVSLARSAGDRLAEGRALAGIGMLSAYVWDSGVAQEHLERALLLHRMSGDISTEARTLSNLGGLAANQGKRKEAKELLVQALARAREAGDPTQVARCLNSLGTLEHGLGRIDAALANFDEAIAIVRELGMVPFYLPWAGFAAQELGRWQEAEARYREAIARVGHVHPYALAAAYGYLGSLLHERGQLEEARLRYEDALASAKNGPASSGIQGVMRASYGALLAKLGNTAEAATELNAASAMLSSLGGEWAEYVAVHHGHLDLALAREREAIGEVLEAERLRAQAAERLGNGDGAGEDLRFARRLLARELAALQPVAEAAPDVLVIGPDARWLRFRDGPVIELDTRPLLRGLLLALTRARLVQPGEPLSAEALLREGWKGERMSARAGLNRLRVALYQLRAKGLRDAIKSRDEGYLLAPSVRVVMSDEALPAARLASK
jgi:predicted ATPase/Tfp pilus assembly protein PilF